MFDVNIVGTGSSGNMIIIDKEIIIDVGLKYKDVKHLLENFTKIFITHRHADHLNISVLKNIINDKDKPRPWKLKHALHTNQDVAEKIKSLHNSKFKFEVNPDNIFTTNDKFDIFIGDTKYTVETFLLDHDVENQGFVFTKEVDGEEYNLIFATDTRTLKHAPKRKYDYIVVEGNYDEDKLFDHMHSEDPDERRRAIRNLRHLSIQQYEDFVKRHAKPNSKVYQLHESGSYGIKSKLGINNFEEKE